MMTSAVTRIVVLIISLRLLYGSDANAQTSPSYAQMWQQVNSLMRNQQPESSLKMMENIYRKSLEERNQIQQIKAFVEIRYVKNNSDEGYVPNPTKVWEKELNLLQPVNQSVLLAYQGDFLISLLNRDRGDIYGRTKGAAQPDDIVTWDLTYFKNRIDSCFIRALSNHQLLSEIPSRNYSALTDTVESMWRYRPTLLDLVAAKALEFYKNDGLDPSPIPFSWAQDTTLYSDPFLFKPDTGRYDSRVFDIFSLLEHYHRARNDHDALLHLQFDRMDYVHQHTMPANRDERFLNALTVLAEKIGEHPFKANVLEKQADVLAAMASGYDPSLPATETYRMKLREAARLYEEVIRRYADSPAGHRSVNKFRQLQAPFLQINVENITRKGFPFAVLAHYKNLNKVKARLSRVNHSEYLKFLQSDSYYGQNIPFKSFTDISETDFKLIADDDLRDHTTELIFPKLKAGLYHLELTGITEGDTCISRAIFTVSGMSFSERDGIFNVMNIENGLPVKGAAIEIFRKNNKEWVASKYSSTVDARIKPSGMNSLLQITCKDDTLLSRWYFSATSEPKALNTERLYLFTDRSIYRPGQPVFFKGILLNSNRNGARAVENRSVEVVLRNSNDQSIDTLILETNHYGTISGKINLPSGELPGYFRLISNRGEISFRVEEYRRPGFKIGADDLKGEYRLNSQVEVSGKVVSFSGVPLKNVNGKFRVLRVPVWFRRSPGVAELIGDGSFTTDEEGKYRFSFTARPDERYSLQPKQSFRFEIQTEVTDITGETQVATKSVRISHEAFSASISGPAVVDSDKSRKEIKFTFDLRNSDNQPVHAEGKIELILLKSPSSPLRNRLWEHPDRPIYSNAQWEQLYPGNWYGEAVQPVSYHEVKVVGTIGFDSEKQKEACLSIAALKPGYYKVRLTTKDKFGSDVRAEHLVRIFNSSGKFFPFPENYWINLAGSEGPQDENSDELPQFSDPTVSVSSVLPGDTIELLLGNYGKQHWKVFVGHGADTVAVYDKLIDRSMAKIVIPVLSAHQGGLIISASSICQGRKIDKVFHVNVPWIQKTLNVSVAKFPEISIPGKEVRWNVKVTDHNHQPVKAEMAGVVYDASLDKILPHDWQLKIWDNLNIYHRLRFPQDLGFGDSQCTQPPWLNELPEVLPALRNMSDFGLTFSDRTVYIRGTAKSGRNSEPSVTIGYGMLKKTPGIAIENADRSLAGSGNENSQVKLRSDFRETAWFDAHIETDENGQAEVRFNLPESVTEWKFMALAHTSEGLSGTITRKFITRKPLMTEPFPTRFLTAGDSVILPVKITNLSGKSLNTEVMMELSNVEGDKSRAASSREQLTLADGKSRSVNWKFTAPAGAGRYLIRVTARGEEYSDGYESLMPVEPDRKWIHETKAFTVKPGENYQLKLSRAGSIQPIQEGKWNLTLMTNPIGMITDALPQLMGDESTTTTGNVSKLTGVLILRKILADHPAIAADIERQRQTLLTSPDSFKTRLEKGEQFTNVKLSETPWLSESEYEKEKLSMFRADSVTAKINEAIARLEKAQMPDGGFGWCPGMESSEWITAQILNDLARMSSQNLLNGHERPKISAMAIKVVNYLDQKMVIIFRRLNDKDKVNFQPSSLQFDYLYARCAFKEIKFTDEVSEAYHFFLEKASGNWAKTEIRQQVQLAYVLSRDETNPALLTTIIRSLRERAIKNNELGMYWKQPRGIFFYREPDIALQSMMIELFGEIHAPAKEIDAMKLWLLQQKRTHAWETTYATARAIYSLTSGEVITNEPQPLPEIILDGKKLVPDNSTGIDGFIKLAIDRGDINAESRLTIRNNGQSILFGGLYHGFFKQVNDTAGSGETIKIRKEIFSLVKSGRGDSLVRATAGSGPGDLLMVRLLIDNDRDLGFVTIDDQRPAGTEPTKQLSAYEYNGGLWYYRVNSDKGTRFFIANLPKGRYVLEYPVRVSHQGVFSAGRVSIQCAFAPEFGADHSPGKLHLMP